MIVLRLSVVPAQHAQRGFVRADEAAAGMSADRRQVMTWRRVGMSACRQGAIG